MKFILPCRFPTAAQGPGTAVTNMVLDFVSELNAFDEVEKYNIRNTHPSKNKIKVRNPVTQAVY